MMDDDEGGAVIGMISRRNASTRRKLPQCHFIHHKSHDILSVFEPEPPWWEPSD
jgi:hypothetical protein